MAHEEGALSDLGEITKADVKWLNRFVSRVNNQRDPISKYEKRAKRYAIWSKVKVVLLLLLFLTLAIAVVVIAKNNQI